MRPWEWIKNLLVLAPLFFAGFLMDPVMVQRSLGGFLVFCLIASAVYILNDFKDRESDSLHPCKAKRPLASGALSAHLALSLAVFLAIIGFGVAWTLSKFFMGVLGIYVLINVMYTFWLKHIIILDVLIISMGFVLRIVAGADLVNVQPSNWIIMCTILLSLFLALSKRRFESQTLQHNAVLHRRVLKGYNPYFLDQLIAVVTASTVISYALYAITIGAFQIYSVFFVIFGIFRYLYLLHGGMLQGTPTELLLADRPLLVTLVFWGLFLMADIYFF